MNFEAARNGLLCLTLLEGTDLPDRSGLIAKFLTGDKQDPYCLLKYGGQKGRTKTCKDVRSVRSLTRSEATSRSNTHRGNHTTSSNCTLCDWQLSRRVATHCLFRSEACVKMRSEATIIIATSLLRSSFPSFALHRSLSVLVSLLANSLYQQQGGIAPNFFNEKVYFWTKDLMWQDKLKISLYDDDVGKDDLIARCELDLLQYFSVALDDSNKMRRICFSKKKRPKKSKKEDSSTKVMLPSGDPDLEAGVPNPDSSSGGLENDEINSDDEEGGSLIAKVDFMPAGKLTILLKSGRNLRNTELVGKMEPYIAFELGKDIKQSKGGAAAHQKLKSKVHKDGGTNPAWNQSFEFDVVDTHEISISCYDKDTLGRDDLVGETTYSLMSAFKNGLVNTYVVQAERARRSNTRSPPLGPLSTP